MNYYKLNTLKGSMRVCFNQGAGEGFPWEGACESRPERIEGGTVGPCELLWGEQSGGGTREVQRPGGWTTISGLTNSQEVGLGRSGPDRWGLTDGARWQGALWASSWV